MKNNSNQAFAEETIWERLLLQANTDKNHLLSIRERTINPTPTLIHTLPTLEATLVEKATLKRQEEFASGRTLIRECLANIGIPDANSLIIGIGECREPLLPITALGSISHCDHYCVAIAGLSSQLSGIGLDIEHNQRLPKGTDALILTPRELKQLPSHQLEVPLETVIFSIKESFYKAYFSKVKCYFDFQDAEVFFDEACFKKGPTNPSAQQGYTFHIQLNKPIDTYPLDPTRYQGYFLWDDTYIYTLILIPYS